MPNRFKETDSLGDVSEVKGMSPESSNEPAISSQNYDFLQKRKQLYKSGLQNIFNDYQENIGKLSKAKQESIQDAYFVREMSTKYLGEHAANTGVGDVSGNLLDVYGSYQQNLQGIRENFGDLKVGLEQQYQQQRAEMLAEKMMVKHEMDVAKLQGQEQKVFYDVASGNFDPNLNEQEYLEQQLENNEISAEFYRQASLSLMEQNEEDLYNNISQGFIGEHENVQEYVDSYEGRISRRGYEQLSMFAEGQQMLQEQSQLHNIFDSESEHYVGDDYDFNLMTNEGDVGLGSSGFQDSAGNRFFTNRNPYDADEHYETIQETPNEVYDRMRHENPEAHGPLPKNSDIVTVRATHKESEQVRSVDYMFDGSTWRRLVPETDPDEQIMQDWYIPEEDAGKRSENDIEISGSNFKIENYHKRSIFNPLHGREFNLIPGLDPSTKDAPAMTINGVRYELDSRSIRSGYTNEGFETKSSSLSSEQKNILEKFNDTHKNDDGIRNHSFVYHNRNMYYHNDGEVFLLNRVDD